MRIIFIAFVMVLTVFMVILSFRAIYVAFIMKKDERSKWIVTKSMADSFIVTVILQAVLLIIKWINYEFYQQWWSNFKEGIYIEPVILSFIILGTLLLINAKRHGGSL